MLCVGGGIGTPSRAADYLTGRWALAYGTAAAPVDGVMVGTGAEIGRASCRERV